MHSENKELISLIKRHFTNSMCIQITWESLLKMQILFVDLFQSVSVSPFLLAVL